MAAFEEIEGKAQELFRSYGYTEIRTPIFESKDLFVRSVGSDTDIVSKEMYVFKDKKGRELTLRPEATASVVRAWLENNLGADGGVSRLFYIGPMFRHERPQAGRYRQFHQLGCEILGAGTIEADVELIDLTMRLLQTLAIDGQLKINHIGGDEDKRRLADAIRSQAAGMIDDFCSDCRDRLDRNALRLLDCKNPKCRTLVEERILPSLPQSDSPEFVQLKKGLTELQIPFLVEPRLVRGLDYYTGTVFEVTSDMLGAQDALLGGGRYDNLVSELGGPSTPAVGFALGLDRLATLLIESDRDYRPHAPFFFVIGLGEAPRIKASRFAQLMRRAFETRTLSEGGAHRRIDLELQGRSLRSALKQADKLESQYAVIIGDEELERGTVVLRDMTGGNQVDVEIGEMSEHSVIRAAIDDGIRELVEARKTGQTVKE